MVLGVGIDWAEAFPLVVLGHPDEGVIQVLRIEHTPAAVDQLAAQIAALEPDPAEVRVVLETRHGLLVERLLDAGYTVLPVNPDLVARRRGPARKKDDAEDARICCLLALDRHTSLRPLIPTGSWLGSCGPSPATTSVPPETSVGCSTGCAKTSSRPTRPRW
jgi:transposase